MKQKLKLSDLITFLKSDQIELTDEQKDKLTLYYEELVKWSGKINLMSKGDQDHIIERHFLPSFYYSKYLINLDLKPEAAVLDLGTGAGLPGIILSIMLNNEFTLIDSSRKKTLFLKNIKNKLNGQQNIICARVEDETFIESGIFDVVTARAVAPLAKLVELVWPILRPDGYLLTLKGENYRSEFKGNLTRPIKITELEPIPKWAEFSNHLQNKLMLKLEKEHV